MPARDPSRPRDPPAPSVVAVRRPRALLPLVRHLSRPLTRVLLLTPLRPNHVTALSLLFAIAAGTQCLAGDRQSLFVAALLFTGSYVLDNCDGEVARARNLQSRFGMRFDTFVDGAAHARGPGTRRQVARAAPRESSADERSPPRVRCGSLGPAWREEATWVTRTTRS